jgi:enterochelin esterase-like enzyme
MKLRSIRFEGWLLTIVFILSACASAAESVPLPTVSPVVQVTATVTMPIPIAKASACEETSGYFEFFEMPSEIMNYPMEGRVYLPPCYDADAGKRYPVLYFLHGQSFKDDQWDRLGADEALDVMVTSGEIAPFIIVMPKETNYMNSQWDSKYGISLAEELVPFIDEKYQTIPEREARAIGGLSRGAAWAMRTGMIYWETFSAIGCHSFAPFRGDYNEAPFWFQKVPLEQQHRIYIDMGFLDVNLDPAYVFETRLMKYGIPHEWHVFHGTHNEAYWSEHVAEYLFWYAQGWK